MSRLNILPEDILIKIYKECFNNTLRELEQYNTSKILYYNVIIEIQDIADGLWSNFDFSDLDGNIQEDTELIGFSHMMLLELHNILDLMIEY